MSTFKSTLSSLFIKRPVFTWVLNIALSLVGLALLRNVVLRENPQIETPSIRITHEYPGASTQVIEQQIAHLMEEELAGIEGLQSITTNISKSGTTSIYMTFNGQRSTDNISNEIEAKLRRIKNSFPHGLKDPVIEKTAREESNAVTLSLTGGNFSSSELSDIAYRYAKSDLEAISGVASVKVSGIAGEGRTYRIDVWLDPDKLFAFNLTAMDVFNAINKQSYIYPAGNIEINNIRYSATITNELKSADEFGNVVLKEKEGKVVKVSDVARVQMQNSDDDVRTRYNGEVASFINIANQPQANKITIAKKVKQKLSAINKSLPPGVKLSVVIDQSEPVKQSLNRVVQSIFEAIIFVVAVMLFFLRSWRAALIPLIAVPICLLAGIITIYAFGFSINTITLLAMVLAIGLVVDDAIVAIEVIERRMHKGETAMQASINGMSEIQFSIIAMTLTLIAVYTPIALSSGMVGKVFTEFAVSLSAMVLTSGFVALTLTPVMTSSLFTNNKTLDWPIITRFNDFITYIELKYKEYLKLVIKHTKYILAASAIIGGLGLLTAKYGIKSILSPEQDSGLVRVEINPTSGATVKYMEYTIATAETLIKRVDGVESVYSDFSSGSDKATLIAILKPFSKRSSCKKIEGNIRDKIRHTLPGAQTQIYCISNNIAGSSDNKLSLFIKSNKSYDELESTSNRMVSTFRNHRGLKDIRHTKIAKEKTFSIEPKKDRALALGVDLGYLKDNIAMIMRGNPPAIRYERNGKRYPVSVWADEIFRQDMEGIKRFHVYSNIAHENDRSTRKLVQLKDIVQVIESSSRPSVIHSDGMRAFEIIADLNPGYDPVKVYYELEEQVSAKLPYGYIVSPGLNIKNLIEEGGNFSLILMLALMFIFLILAAQFESFYDPIIIMTSVPFALAGAIFTIFLIPGLTLNVYSQIGLVTLIGLITKHAVLIVDYYKKSIANGLSTIDAAIEASLLRLRPILMTTFAMVLGAFPLILASGFGSEVRREIGWVIVGGMSFGTLCTLFIVPMACILLTDLRYKFMQGKIKIDKK